MSAAKHTSPWRVHKFPAKKITTTLTGAGHYGKEYVAVVGADGEVICDNAQYYAQPIDAKKACLIAAAPELLEIAQMVANVGEYRELVEKMAQALRPQERAAFIKLFREDARAAIAKATGGAA